MKDLKGTYLNIDIDVFAYILNGSCNDLSNLREKIDLYIEGYKGHGISDLIFNIFGQSSIVPTKVVDWFYDTYDRTVEDGKPVDYTAAPHPKAMRMAYDMMEDPVGYMLESAGSDFRVWLSYRMNDCHHCYLETSELRSETLYYHAKKNGGFLPEHLSPRPYHGLLDYSDPHIRRVMLDYIKETLYRYCPYGIELDFLREHLCLDYEKIPNACGIMTDFMTNLKAITDGYTRELGREVKILVRLPRSVNHCKTFGFDVKEWIRLGLVDVISPSTRWYTSDFDMPVSDWKALCEGTDVELAVGLEYYAWDKIKVSEECAKGFAAQYLDCGADRIYLYNHYREALELPDMTKWYKSHPGFTLASSVGAFDSAPWDLEKLKRIDAERISIWEATKSREAAKSGARRSLLTFEEPFLVPVGAERFDPLPIKIHGEVNFKKLTGDVTDGRVTLFLGVKAGVTPPRVLVDGREAPLLGKSEDAYFAHPELQGPLPERFEGLEYYAYAPTVSGDLYRDITFISDDCSVEYLEFKAET